MSRVAAPADKRFRRAHVKPGRRRKWRTIARPIFKYGVMAAVLVFSLYRGGVMIAHARALQIDRITVRGNVQISNEAVLETLAGLPGQNILRIALGAWRERLLTSPWIKDAALRRVLPSTIEVVVQEREPVGIGRIDGRLYLVDQQGVLIDRYGPAYADFDLPIVDGLQGSKKGGNGAVDPARAELAGRVIMAIRSDPDIGGRLSQVDVGDVRNAGVILSGDPALLYVGTEKFLPRLQSYLQLAETMNDRVPGIDSVDLRFDDRVYVQLVGKARKRKT